MNTLFRIKSLIKYLIDAKPASGHGIHSPFVFHFATEVILPVKSGNVALPELMELRKQLEQDARKIFVEDFGTGKSGKRKIKSILSQSSSDQRMCAFLFSTIKYFKPASVLELGTNLGLSAASMALVNSNINVITIEGSAELAGIAKENFNKLKISNIKQLSARFEEKLDSALSMLKTPFIAFIDGNHRYQATINYFNTIAKAADDKSFIIIDDIHHSEEMEKAWNEIQKYSNVILTIDMYRFGIVFFQHGLSKVNYSILF